MELQRLKAVNERIAGLEEGIQRLKEQGQSTVEAERLLGLMRQSRFVMQRHSDLITSRLEKTRWATLNTESAISSSGPQPVPPGNTQ
jgi:hypothetical protein